MSGDPEHSGPRDPFPLTEWSLIGRAADIGGEQQSSALAALLHRYHPALRAHLVATRRLPPDRADDLLQGFIADKMIEKNLLEHARKEKGRFRSFLLVTLNRYVISEHRRASAQARSPAGAVSNLGDEAEQVPTDDDPAENYTLAWGRELVAEALRRMKRECEDSNRDDLWVVFEGRIVRPTFEGVEPLAYEQLVRELSLATPLVACNLLVTAKRMFSRSLRAVVAEYSESDAQIDEELADLRRILSGGA